MKTISKPSLQSARSLTAPEMNRIHFSAQRTVLTPQLLARIASQTSAAKKAAAVDIAAGAPAVPKSAANTPISASKPGDTEINFG
jgi:hypothetical protein